MLSKKPKCESQRQCIIVDSKLVFSITGTNITKPGIKRRWEDESEDLVRGIQRKRNGVLVPVGFKLLSSSKQKEIGNSQGLNREPISAWEKMQANFKAMFAVDDSVHVPQPSEPCGGNPVVPVASTGQPPGVIHDQFPMTAQDPVQSIFPVRDKRTNPRVTSRVRVAGVKWGKPSEKKLKTCL